MGIIFIVLGVLALAYHGMRYTSKEKLIVVGPQGHGYRGKGHPVASNRGWNCARRGHRVDPGSPNKEITEFSRNRSGLTGEPGISERLAG